MGYGRETRWALAACALALVWPIATPGLADATSTRPRPARTYYWRGSSRTLPARAELRAAHATRGTSGNVGQPRPIAADQHAPPCAERPATTWCSRTIEGRGQPREYRRRAPESWSARDLSHNRSPAAPGRGGVIATAQLTAGEAVFHDAHAPPARP